MQRFSGSGVPEVMSTGVQHLSKAATPGVRRCWPQRLSSHRRSAAPGPSKAANVIANTTAQDPAHSRMILCIRPWVERPKVNPDTPGRDHLGTVFHALRKGLGLFICATSMGERCQDKRKVPAVKITHSVAKINRDTVGQ